MNGWTFSPNPVKQEKEPPAPAQCTSFGKICPGYHPYKIYMWCTTRLCTVSELRTGSFNTKWHLVEWTRSTWIPLSWVWSTLASTVCEMYPLLLIFSLSVCTATTFSASRDWNSSAICATLTFQPIRLLRSVDWMALFHWKRWIFRVTWSALWRVFHIWGVSLSSFALNFLYQCQFFICSFISLFVPSPSVSSSTRMSSHNHLLIFYYCFVLSSCFCATGH